MDALKAIMSRTSVRSYKSDQISDEALEAILEAGKSGPGSGAYHLSVIQKPDLLRRINDATKAAMLASGVEFSVKRASLPGYEPLYGAPTMILLSAGDASAVANTSCSAENMLIAATALGLGSCYLMSIRAAFSGDGGRALAEECGVPEGSDVVCAAIVGHSDGEKFKSDRPKIRTSNRVR